MTGPFDYRKQGNDNIFPQLVQDQKIEEDHRDANRNSTEQQCRIRIVSK